ncbi:non-ribosomal peptide synthetase, partial [Mesorhizobium sp. M00.F.Ca.ET.186.01.1.1]
DRHHWNQARMLFCRDGLEREWVVETLNALVLQHDALRMRFRETEQGIVQFHQGNEGKLFGFHVFDCTEELDIAEKVEEKANEWQAGMNLQEGPLVQAALFMTRTGDHLLLAIHQLVVDEASWRIILEDFQTAYKQKAAGESIALPNKTHSYQSWAEELHNAANSKKLTSELGYWRKIASCPTRPLPQDQQPLSRTEQSTATAAI